MNKMLVVAWQKMNEAENVANNEQKQCQIRL